MATKKAWQSQAQLQLEAMIKDGTVVCHELTISKIRIEPDKLQSRLLTDKEHAQRMADTLMCGRELPPVVVVREFLNRTQSRWIDRLADGFHRALAHGKCQPARTSITAWVIPGGMKEAVEFSASANLENSKPTSVEDRKKALRMLLEWPEWMQATRSKLGNQCGVSPDTASRHREEYCLERGLPKPETFVERQAADGQIIRIRTSGRCREPGAIPRITTRKIPGRKPRYLASVEGRKIELGTDLAAAERTVRVIAHRELEEIRQRQACRSSLKDGRKFRDWLLRRRVLATPIQGAEYGLLVVGVDRDHLAPCDPVTRDTFLASVAQLTLARKASGLSGRLVVVGYRFAPRNLHLECLLALAAQPPDPILFLTPEEVVALYQGQADDQPDQDQKNPA